MKSLLMLVAVIMMAGCVKEDDMPSCSDLRSPHYDESLHYIIRGGKVVVSERFINGTQCK